VRVKRKKLGRSQKGTTGGKGAKIKVQVPGELKGGMDTVTVRIKNTKEKVAVGVKDFGERRNSKIRQNPPYAWVRGKFSHTESTYSTRYGKMGKHPCFGETR